MGRRRYTTGVFKVNVQEGEAPFQQITAKRKYSDIHSLLLTVSKIFLCREGSAGTGVFSTGVCLGEINGKKRRENNYSFDFEGGLLNHSFFSYMTRFDGSEALIESKRDMSTRQLREYGKDIAEMLEGVKLPEGLAQDVTVKRLTTNEIKE